MTPDKMAVMPRVSAAEHVRVPLASRAEALASVRTLLPLIKQRAARTESDRQVPHETIQELIDASLFGVVTPRMFGGSELGFSTLVAVTAELASVCGSTGWVYGVLAGHSWLLNLFPLAAQQEVFGKRAAPVATVFRLAGTVTAEEQGFRLTGGEGRFCSGIDHARWVIVGCSLARDDGEREPWFFVLPREQVDVIDDWYAAGMRGTGSKTIRIATALIPRHRAVSLKDLRSGKAPGAQAHCGAIYRIPFQDIAPFSLIGAPLGMARAALKALTTSMAPRLASFAAQQLAEQSATLARLGETAADIDSAYALVLEDACQLESAEPDSLTDLDRMRFMRDWAYAAQVCRRAVTRLFEAGWGTGIYNTSELQRVWRDVNSAAQHFAFNWDSAMTGYGRTLLDLPVTGDITKGR